MKGDFSKWRFFPEDNFHGVLHQQGRVLLDSDWNAQTRITANWQAQAGEDIIGPDVAAIPADQPNSFKVVEAVRNGSVSIVLKSGRAWVDGLLVYLKEDVSRIATYLQSPAPSISAGVRDAVILEVWQEAINGFQEPEKLIEPALGGPDTTERIHTAMALRLLRLDDNDTCRNIRNKLDPGIFKRGTLKVFLQPTREIDERCPTVEGGGYTGFEHHVYRTEIAQVNSGPQMFKWSQFNGGLVGRGIFHAGSPNTVEITANLQAIVTSGLEDCYLEAVQYDQSLGYWRVTYGTKATLNKDVLELSSPPILGRALPIFIDPNQSVFFRLWNGIRALSEFPAGAEKATQLRDGIFLEFTPSYLAGHRPGDYWTFPVRAGEIGNLEVLIAGEPPEGIHYHRVPLAILNWTDNTVIRFEDNEIHDCRRIFRPLINQTACCSFTVGDGKSTHGDFNSIEEAVRHLPESGGEICLLPGLHEANVVLEGKHGITIRGCDQKTIITPGESDREAPIFSIKDCTCIRLKNMGLATLEGTAIVLEGAEEEMTLQEIEISHTLIHAYTHAIRVDHGVNINIHNNTIRMLDREGGDVAIYMSAKDSQIEDNDIGVLPAEHTLPSDAGGDGQGGGDPTEECVDMEDVYAYIPYFIVYIQHVWFVPFYTPLNPFSTPGGIQIAGGSESIKILDNRITGGSGNGITLGSKLDLAGITGEEEEEMPVIEYPDGPFRGWVMSDAEQLDNFTFVLQHSDGESVLVDTKDDESLYDKGYFSEPLRAGRYTVFSANPEYKVESVTIDPQKDEFGEFYHINVVKRDVTFKDLFALIYDLRIEGNRIANMGLSGIGTPLVKMPSEQPPEGGGDITFGLQQQVTQLVSFPALIGNPVVTLAICRNHITNCFQDPFQLDVRTEIRQKVFGGISLWICEDVFIHENRIEGNGFNHIYPVCGIYSKYGGHVEIARNHVIDNGPLAATLNDDLVPGIRGGIVLWASNVPTLIRKKRNSTIVGEFAARVHDNVVAQPVGQALRIWASGPVSVLNNRFNSEFQGTEPLNKLAGAVFICNVRGRGDTLFNNNQTQLGSGDKATISQFIVSFGGDLGFDGNQSMVYGNGPTSNEIIPPTNTLLFGWTLRANHSRFMEPPDSEWILSLLALSDSMNTTIHNQGNHCIIAFKNKPSELLRVENQVLNEAEQGCAELFKTLKLREILEMLEEMAFDALSIMRVFHEGLYILLQHELKKHKKSLGKEVLRKKVIKQQLEKNSEILKDMNIERQVAKVRTPDVGEDDTLFHGRIITEDGLGIKGFVVHLTDETGRMLVPLGSAEADVSGYYVFVIAPDTFRELSSTLKKGVFPAVYTKTGTLIHRQLDPLKVVKGDRRLVDLVLTERSFRPTKQPEKPPTEKDEDVKDEEIKPPVLEDIVGIGAARGKKLRDAGIKEVKDFVEADETKLREILGNLDISDFKKQGLALLKK